MLHDIKLSDNEPLNIEQILPLIKAQRTQKDQKNSDLKLTHNDELDLTLALTQAVKKNQWRLALLLLTSPIKLPDEMIATLANHKDKIINSGNLQSTTLHGQFILNRSLQDIEDIHTNLYRLGNYQLGILAPRIFGILGKPVGTLGCIWKESQIRKEKKSDAVLEKHNRIISSLVNAAKIDAMTASPAAKECVNTFARLLESWFKSSDYTEYNPLYLIFEVFAMLADKGYDPDFKHQEGYSPLFNAIKIHLDSPKVSATSRGSYRGNYGIHIKIYSKNLELLGTILHEFTHLLCKLIYKNVATRYKKELKELAIAMKSFMKKNHDKIVEDITILNYFDNYSEENYSNEMFPRIVQHLLLHPHFDTSQVFPLDISVKLQHLFSLFMKDIAEFMVSLSDQHQHATSRVKLLEYYEAGDFKNFYRVVTPDNYRAFDFFPIHSSKDNKSLRLAIRMNFPIHDVNKFNVSTIKFSLDNNKFENAIILLEKLWEEKKLTYEIGSSGMDINQQDQNGQSLLMHAIKAGCGENFIEWLLKICYADPTLADHNNISVLDYVRLGITSRRIVEAINNNLQLYTTPGA